MTLKNSTFFEPKKMFKKFCHPYENFNKKKAIKTFYKVLEALELRSLRDSSN